jgi:hypothetical protein
MGRMDDTGMMINVHLSATEDEALLRRRNTRLLLYFLFDSGDLRQDEWGILDDGDDAHTLSSRLISSSI